jgi:cysteine desulfuration protein SufE
MLSVNLPHMDTGSYREARRLVARGGVFPLLIPRGRRARIAPHMDEMPPKLQAIAAMFAGMSDRAERMQALMDIGAGFRPVPESVASRPFPESHKVPHCESQAYVWAEPLPDGTLRFHFAVENPQGIAAKATAAILAKTLSGAPLDQVLAVQPDVIYEIFGRELSMGKNLGLSAMLGMCKRFAAEAKRASSGPAAG